MRFRAHLLSLLGAFLLVASAAHADTISIVLTASGSGQFDYALDTGSTGAVFNDTFGDFITFSGLSGVTNASVSGFPALCFTPSFTPTSATFTTSTGASCGLPPGAQIGTFSIFSSSPSGTVNYAIQSSVPGEVNGTVTGPVGSPVPEPASFALLASGLTGVYRITRRKLRK